MTKCRLRSAAAAAANVDDGRTLSKAQREFVNEYIQRERFQGSTRLANAIFKSWHSIGLLNEETVKSPMEYELYDYLEYHVYGGKEVNLSLSHMHIYPSLNTLCPRLFCLHTTATV